MSTLPAVLIVDDDADVLKAAALALMPVAQVDTAPSPQVAARMVGARAYGAILLDMNFALGERGGSGGFDALAVFKATDPAVSIILMTAYGGVALAVEGLKRGACDFLLKPWRNDALASAVLEAVSRSTAARKAQAIISLDEVEADAVRRALTASGGNVAAAATALGLTRQALYRRMERHGL